MLWLLAKGKLVRPIILTDEQNKTEGYISSSDLDKDTLITAEKYEEIKKMFL